MWEHLKNADANLVLYFLQADQLTDEQVSGKLLYTVVSDGST